MQKAGAAGDILASLEPPRVFTYLDPDLLIGSTSDGKANEL